MLSSTPVQLEQPSQLTVHLLHIVFEYLILSSTHYSQHSTFGNILTTLTLLYLNRSFSVISVKLEFLLAITFITLDFSLNIALVALSKITIVVSLTALKPSITWGLSVVSIIR